MQRRVLITRPGIPGGVSDWRVEHRSGRRSAGLATSDQRKCVEQSKLASKDISSNQSINGSRTQANLEPLG